MGQGPIEVIRLLRVKRSGVNHIMFLKSERGGRVSNRPQGDIGQCGVARFTRGLFADRLYWGKKGSERAVMDRSGWIVRFRSGKGLS